MGEVYDFKFDQMRGQMIPLIVLMSQNLQKFLR